MKILAYIITEWDAFVAAIENLVGWHKATGTVPTVPPPPADDGAVTSPVIVAPPATTTTTLPPEIDTPDGNGAVKLMGVTDPAYIDKRWMCLAVLPLLTPGSQAYGCVEWNCNSAKMEETASLLIACAKTVEPTTDLATGAPSWQMTNTVIEPPVFVVPAEHATWADATAYVNELAARAATVHPGGGSFSPSH